MEPSALPRLIARDYDGVPWYYEPPVYLPHRFILGTVGEKPLACIGINPSTARPGALDNTLKSVQRLALANGFDSSAPSGPLTPTIWTPSRTRPWPRKTWCGWRPCWPRPAR